MSRWNDRYKVEVKTTKLSDTVFLVVLVVLITLKLLGLLEWSWWTVIIVPFAVSVGLWLAGWVLIGAVALVLVLCSLKKEND